MAEGLQARLRELRQTGLPEPVSQKHLAQAFGVSVSLISSWENGSAVPPEDRLNAYAQFFATPRSMAGPRPALIDVDDLDRAEDQRRQALIEALFALREAATDSDHPRERGALGGRFWYFPDDQPITILCSPLSSGQLGYATAAAESGALTPAVQYTTNEMHPNYIRNISNGDVDALIELAAHIRAENPTSWVRWKTNDRVQRDDLSGHVVMLGAGDAGQVPGASEYKAVFEGFVDLLDLPLAIDWGPDVDPEFGGCWKIQVDKDGQPEPRGKHHRFVRPRFARQDAEGRPFRIERGAKVLDSDVALILRMKNPLNDRTTVTMFSGIFSRGTYGAVRAFTDEAFRARNEEWVMTNADPKNFWVLAEIKVFAGIDTITPDLGRPSTRLWRSA